MRILRIGLILSILLLIALCAARKTATVPAAEVHLAKELVSKLAKADYAAVRAHFTLNTCALITEADLAADWQAAAFEAGQFLKVASTRTETANGHSVVYLTCQFEKRSIDIIVAFDTEGKVAGLHFSTAMVPLPPYVDTKRFTERDVIVGKGKWALPGTLTVPRGTGPFPGVVLVHGSGPSDRDETGGRIKPLRDIALGLASRGVAVLRYDKRTYSHDDEVATLLVPGSSFTVQDEVIDDALAAVATLRDTKDVNPKRVFVLGHSFGGMLAPRIGEQDRAIAGLIILAGPTRRITDVLSEQVDYTTGLDGIITDAEQAQLAMVAKENAEINDPALTKDSQKLLAGPCPAGYWLDLRDYSPAALAQRIGLPMLIMQGGRDYQATSDDYEGWKRAVGSRKNVTFRFYATLDHMFFPGNGRPAPPNYEAVNHPAVTVVDDIASWVKSR